MCKVHEEASHRWRITVQLWMACLSLGLWLSHSLHSIWRFLLRAQEMHRHNCRTEISPRIV